MSRAKYHSLLQVGLSGREYLILHYLIDMCNEWGFTTETVKSITEFFDADISNTSKRVKRLIQLDAVKIVEYNGRSGFMVNPEYCYQGPLYLRRFRVKLWAEEKIYTKYRPGKFYGPPVLDQQHWRNIAIARDKHGRFAHIRNIHPRDSQ